VVRLAVLGDPLAFTRSPELHRAGLEALGIAGESVALRTPLAQLDERLRALAAEDYTGVNLTHPLKEAALPLLGRVTQAATLARSVNTVGFGDGGSWGDTTDGRGFLDLLRSHGRDPESERVVLLGGGGAARSLAHALVEQGADVTVSARRPEAVTESWPNRPALKLVGWRGEAEREALARATLVVNATPLSTSHEPIEPAAISAKAHVVDLTYGAEPTAWVEACRARGLSAEDGLGLLVHQARRSLALWFGHDVPLESLGRAVGWPR